MQGTNYGSLFAKFDLDVNNQKSTDAVRELDEVKLYNDLKETLTLTKNPEKNSVGYVQSSHLITLYDAGYFSYLRQVTPDTPPSSRS